MVYTTATVLDRLHATEFETRYESLVSRDLAAELRELLHEVDPVRWKVHLAETRLEAMMGLRSRLNTLIESAEQLKEHPNVAQLHEHLIDPTASSALIEECGVGGTLG